jgi:hypothetical protein
VIFSWEVQAAVFAKLNGNIIGAVFDEDPRTGGVATVPPFTVIGETNERAWDTHDSDGSEEEITLHTWSGDNGSKELKTIMAQIDALLHDAQLVLADGVMVGGFQRTTVNVLREQQPNGETWRHAVTRYRVIVTEVDA